MPWKWLASVGQLYTRWPFTQQSEFFFVQDDYFTAGGADNASLLQPTHHPYSGLDGGSGHIGDFLSGEGQGGAELGGEPEQSAGQALFYSFASQVAQAGLGISQASAQDIDNP